MAEERRGRRLVERFQQEDEDDFFHGLEYALSSRVGRRFLWILSIGFGYESDIFTGDRDRTDYLLGRKSAGEEIIRHIRERFPDEYLTLIKETQHVHQTRLSRAHRVEQAGRADDGSDADSYGADDAD